MMKSKKPKIDKFNFKSLLELVENHNIQDSRLVKLIDCLKSLQPTSVNPERAFSLAGWFLSKRRSRMSGQLLDALLFFKENKKYVKIL